MQATVIDTLRYANRLKDAGVDGVQAEAMALAINDELVSGLVTKDDLNRAIGELRAELRAELGDLRTELGALNGKFETQGRHVFLILALIAALGLFNAVAPHLGRTNPAANPADMSAPPRASASSLSGEPLERLGPQS
ncbi:MAG: hypothetical protein OXH15_10420 [Gammaproteobacteria bacterium]|nr:hypothetical protein [Gammaproteobacteria bacterium]